MRVVIIIAVCIFIGIVAYIGAIWYHAIQLEKEAEAWGKYACTEEAMICPDGSSVGRVLPYCKFEKCPSKFRFWLAD